MTHGGPVWICSTYNTKGKAACQSKTIPEAALLGFMPDVVMCRSCGTYLPAELSFSVEGGYFCCKGCRDADSLAHWIDMPAASLQAVRHIVLSDFERIFSFRVGEPAQAPLYAFAEAFLQYHIDRHFPTLDFYKAIGRGA